MKPQIALLALVAVPAAALAAPDAELESTIAVIRSAVQPDEAMQYMRQVYATDRWFTFPKFQETAQYVKRTMEQIGLKNAQVVRPPADGVTQFGYWTMPLAWDAADARLELMGEGIPPEFRVLADYRKIPASLVMWSGPTPPGGITADLVELKSERAEDILKMDLKGKLVLTRQNPAGIKWALARAGALGAVNTSTENRALQDGHQWINSWGDNGWGFLKGNTPLVGFSISPRQAAFVRARLAASGAVKVKAIARTRYYPGTYDYATGVIPGAGSGEEVLTLGHTSEQGAQDNATGVAAMLEGMAALERLITAGKLPRPRRTIRLLAMGELYNSMHFLASDPARMRRTVAAMCLDTPAAPYEMAGTEYTFYLNPLVASSYVDAFVLRLAQDYFDTVQRPFHWKPYMTGTDTFLGEPMIGIPTVWPYAGSGIETHHNSEDTPNRVDARSLRDLSVVTAAFLYYLASAQRPQAVWLADVARQRGEEQIRIAAEPFLKRAAAARQPAELGRILQDAQEKIAFAVDRQSQAVRSVERLAPGVDVAEPLDRLRRAGEEQSQRIQAAANQRAAALGAPVPVRPAAAAPDARLAEAAKIVVQRKRIGSLPLDDLAPDQREGFPSGAWATNLQVALFWCDGHRNLAEVIRLTRLELGPSKFDWVGYFRFLRKHGYVDFQ
ncbi:MAG TPA: M28 family peptidase [Bryobacteraceae bacterium]|nr:M28 family peptidase [Bryobacteraceae bacterium]